MVKLGFVAEEANLTKPPCIAAQCVLVYVYVC